MGRRRSGYFKGGWTPAERRASKAGSQLVVTLVKVPLLLVWAMIMILIAPIRAVMAIRKKRQPGPRKRR
jgi:hypothetical protein